MLKVLLPLGLAVLLGGGDRPGRMCRRLLR
jgi:hypothetical protein